MYFTFSLVPSSISFLESKFMSAIKEAVTAWSLSFSTNVNGCSKCFSKTFLKHF